MVDPELSKLGSADAECHEFDDEDEEDGEEGEGKGVGLNAQRPVEVSALWICGLAGETDANDTHIFAPSFS